MLAIQEGKHGDRTAARRQFRAAATFAGQAVTALKRVAPLGAAA